MKQAHPQLRDAIDRVFGEWRSEQKVFLDEAQKTLRREMLEQFKECEAYERCELYEGENASL